MAGLSYQHDSTDGYRFGFNNQEKDAELGDYYAFEYRIHDARLGRFLSVDPLFKDYPWNSSYAFAENRVIDGVDLEGTEWCDAIMWINNVTGVTEALEQTYAGQAVNQLIYNGSIQGQVTKAAEVTSGTVKGTINLIKQEYNRACANPADFYLRWSNPLIGISMNAVEGLPDAVTALAGRVEEAATDGHALVNLSTDVALLLATRKGVAANSSKIATAASAESKIATAATSSSPLKVLATDNLATAIAKRKTLINDFYAKYGYVGTRLESHLKAINVNKPVRTITLKKGTIVQQWVDEKGVGNYFTTLENGSAQNLAIKYEGRTLKQFELTEDVKVLESTAADLEGAKGGGIQYFNPDLKTKVTEIKQ